MLNAIIGFSIRNKLIVGLFIAALVMVGVYQTTQLPVDAVPDITNNQVQVITVSPSFGATDIERFITFPVEQSCSNLPELKEMRSFSRFGLSVVTLVFKDEMDIHLARQLVAERLQQIQTTIPTEFGKPQMAPITTGLGEIYQYVLKPAKGYESVYTNTELRTIQDWIVRRQLLSVEGVADVSSFGGLLKQYEISIDPARLKANNTTLMEVFNALQNNNQNTGGAYIEKGPKLLFIRSEGLIGSVSDIEQCVVKNLSNGHPLTIHDIAEVTMGYATRFGAMTYNGEREVAGAVVMMLKGANSNLVIENVKERIKEISQTLPKGIVIEPFLDRTKMVNNSIHTVTTNLMEGALIVVFVLVLFLGNIRAGLLVASVIPLSMLFAIILMNIFGVSGNLMSLGALDFGLIVDGAVIIVEAVMHSLHQKGFSGLDKHSLRKRMDEQVFESSGRMMNSAVFGQIIILVVYLPIFTLQGIEGKMFKPMAQTVAFALAGAFVLSLTYIPMMSALVLKLNSENKPGKTERWMSKLESRYSSLLNRLLNRSSLLFFPILGMLLLAIVLMTQLGGEFIPELPEGDFAIETRILPGSNLKSSTQVVMQAEKLLLDSFPEVEKVVGKTGSSEIPTDPMPIEASDIIVNLKPRSEWTSATAYDELAEKMAQTLRQVPGASFSFQYPVAMRFNELMTGARQDIVCKIFGEQLDTLSAVSKRIGSICAGIDGATDIYVEPVSGMPQIIIRYKRETMAQYGITVSDINKYVNTSFAGQSAGSVYEGEKRFDLVLRLQNTSRQSLQDVQDLLIPLPSGNQLPLRLLADVEIKNGPNQVQRENNQRRIIVGFNVMGKDMQSVVKDLQQAIDKKIQLPPGYRITFGGAFQNLIEAKKRLSIAVPLALALILLLLYFAFNSWKQGFLIFSAVPLSAIGGIFALYVTGLPFSISAGVGFIALFGVAVLNGIVLMAEFNRLNASGTYSLREVVMQGTRNRLRPVLMTAMVASLGFLPMALSNGEGAQVQRPLATVVIGGLLLATFLTLFVIPALYLRFYRTSKPGSVPVAALLIGFLLLSGISPAQSGLSYQQAIDSALKNNVLMRSEKLMAEYAAALEGTARDLPLTSVGLDYGQYNSAYKDYKFSVGQTFKLPFVYSRKKQVLKSESNYAQLNVNLKQKELKKEVGMVFYDYQFLRAKESLLRESDSLFAAYVKRADEQFKQGETNLMDKSLAENQRNQLFAEWIQVRKELKRVALRFALLVNTVAMYIPDEKDSMAAEPSIPSTETMKLHPLMMQAMNRQQREALQLRLEKAKLLPEFFATYNNTSITGIGADEAYYPRSKRFQYVQMGLGIPLFFGTQKSMIRSQKILKSQQELLVQSSTQRLESELQNAVLHLTLANELLNRFERSSLPNANKIKDVADKQLASGEISFMDWILLITKSLDVRHAYLEALHDVNTARIELQFINPN